MKKTLKFLIPIFIFILLMAPALSFAVDIVPECTENPSTGECIYGFNEFLELIDNLVKFILFQLAVPIAAVMFFYAGFIMVTSGGDSASAKTKAKTIFTNALLGLLLAAGAFIIVNTILLILGYDGAWIGFKDVI